MRFCNLDNFFLTKSLDDYIIKKEPEAIDDAKRFLYHVYRSFYRPLVIVVYDREAFLSKFDSEIRITFDKNVRSAIFRNYDDLFDDAKLKPAILNHFVLEVKFDRRFSNSLNQVISKFNLTRLAVSKYANCIDADPDLHQFISNKKLIFNNAVWSERTYRQEPIYHKEAV